MRFKIRLAEEVPVATDLQTPPADSSGVNEEPRAETQPAELPAGSRTIRATATGGGAANSEPRSMESITQSAQKELAAGSDPTSNPTETSAAAAAPVATTLENDMERTPPPAASHVSREERYTSMSLEAFFYHNNTLIPGTLTIQQRCFLFEAKHKSDDNACNKNLKIYIKNVKSAWFIR